MKLKIALLLTFSVVSNLSLAQKATTPDLEFRRILTGLLADRLTPEQLAEVSYATPQALTVAPAFRTPEEFIAKVDQIGQLTQPQALYNEALEKPVVGYAKADIYARMRAKPMTIVVFPGVFSEFIHNRAFEEVFRRVDSSAAVEWRQKIKSLTGAVCTNPKGDACDFSFDFEKLKITDQTVLPMADSKNFSLKYQPLDQYINVASIDDVAHKPILRVILLATEGMSLETLGTIRENSERFTRRLEKYFRLMGTPENIAFLGYSRGTMVALDTLAYNKELADNNANLPTDKRLDKSWLAHVKGMIALGGVTYGTALADDAFTPTTTNGKLIAGLTKLLDSLTDIDSASLEAAGFNTFGAKFSERNRRLSANLSLISNFLSEAHSASNKSIFETIGGLKDQTKGTDVKSSIRLMVEQIEHLGGLKFNGGGLFDFFSIEHRRIDKLCRSVLAATKEMTTVERLKWWSTHNLPLDVRYYAITGTMGDGLTTHPMAFLPDSADDRGLVGNYNDYRAASGVLLNDSQVAVERVRFWPELSAALNPKNSGMKSEYLGVVGTHHWGLALAIVNVNSNGKVNPFPRVELIEALSTKVSSDLIADEAMAAQK